jgi:hypothetical protein
VVAELEGQVELFSTDFLDLDRARAARYRPVPPVIANR